MTTDSNVKILALCGGVGGAKLAQGFAQVLRPEQLLIVVNTADDFTHLGCHISPDLDTVTYTLAGLANKERGWGLAEESWQMMQALQRLGGETWFRLGDRDLATHLFRTQQLREGSTLSEVTRMICQRLGIHHPVVPMTNQTVATQIQTEQSELAFQHYFVREQCRPQVTGFRFAGIEQAQPCQEILEFLAQPDLAAIVLCPSNPFVSIDPILAVPGMKQALRQAGVPILCVSPVVGGTAIKGPTVKMMSELAMPLSATTVAQHYAGVIDGMILDTADEALVDEVETLGIRADVTATVMKTLEDKIALARYLVDLIIADAESL